MAITCPRCGAEFDATLFQFDHAVRCNCGADVRYPGADLRRGHIIVDSGPPHNLSLPAEQAIPPRSDPPVRREDGER